MRAAVLVCLHTHTFAHMCACVPVIMAAWLLRVCLCVSYACCAHSEVVSCAWGGAVGEGAARMRAGGRPGAKERGHIHIHRVGHAHVNCF